jgi:hypothetical protein
MPFILFLDRSIALQNTLQINPQDAKVRKLPNPVRLTGHWTALSPVSAIWAFDRYGLV